MYKVALVTYSRRPELPQDDQVLLPALEKHECQVTVTPWDSGTNWAEFDAVILRSTWDYHERWPEFLNWIQKLQRENVRLWNSPELLKWNANKKYLFDLQRQGVSIFPSVWWPANECLPGLFDDTSSEWVVKPLISASAYQTHRVQNLNTVPMKSYDRLIQPFAQEMLQQGEVSLVYFGGSYSHAARKFPALGDFRVQEDYGGCTEAWTPSTAVLATAEAVVQQIPSAWLYARVDLMPWQGQWVLSELELIEPSFYFQVAPAKAAESFSQSVFKVLREALL